ncbi:secreted protein [Melampsora americana]|nr:secreted protein [Melampsora americana]
MLNIFIARAISSWILFDLVSAQLQGGLPPTVGQMPNMFPQSAGGLSGGFPNGLQSMGQPFSGQQSSSPLAGMFQQPGSGLNTSLPYQCDPVARQEAALNLNHCNLAVGEFFNYGQWVWSTDPLSSRTCSSCRVVLESQSIYAIAVPVVALQKKVFDIISGCANHAGIASLNQGSALPFGSFGPVTVKLQVSQGPRCRATQTRVDDVDEEEEEDPRAIPARAPLADSSTMSRPAAGRIPGAGARPT